MEDKDNEDTLIDLKIRVEIIEDSIHDINYLVPSASDMRQYCKELEEKFLNLQLSTQQRLAEMEEKYKSIDPSYLAMGDNLSKTNKHIVNRLVEIQEWFQRALSVLGERVKELEKKEKQC